MGLDSNLSAHILFVCDSDEGVENVVHAYLSGILAHKVGCVAVLSDNGPELRTKSSMKHVAN